MPIFNVKQGTWRYGKDRGKALIKEGDLGVQSVHQGEAVMKVNSTLLVTDGGGATEVATGAIPAAAQVVSVVGRVIKLITGVTTNFDVGDGSDADIWAAAVLLAVGSKWNQSDATADPRGTWTAAARDITLTADAGVFSTGEVRIDVFYFDATAPED